MENAYKLLIELAAKKVNGSARAVSGYISRRLREAGIRGYRACQIAKDIDAITRRNAGSALRSLAQDVLDQLAEAKEGQPVVIFWRGVTYRLRRAWEPIHDLRAAVTRLLQDAGHEVTRRLLEDIMVNVTAQITRLEDDIQLPHFLRHDGISTGPLLPVSNGMLDLSPVAAGGDPILYREALSWFFTRKLAANFDSVATCSRWLRFLNEVLPQRHERDNRIMRLQEFVGYMLLVGDFRFETFLIVFGSGGNGKITFLETIANLLGEQNVSSVPLENLSGGFSTAEIVEKLANIAGELPLLRRLECNALKQLVSGEKIQINQKYQPTRSVRAIAKLIFATNELPQFLDRSNGMARRILIVPFEQRFGDGHRPRDTNLKHVLRVELPGILNWAIEGLKRLLLQDGFSACEICEEVQQRHRIESDPVLTWLEECTERVPGDDTGIGGCIRAMILPPPNALSSA